MIPGDPHALRLRERKADVLHLRAVIATTREQLAAHTDPGVLARTNARLAAKLSQLAEAERLVEATRADIARTSRDLAACPDCGAASGRPCAATCPSRRVEDSDSWVEPRDGGECLWCARNPCECPEAPWLPESVTPVAPDGDPNGGAA